jgi:ubiquinone/menaquinone biosynthesis C-methylase UbiE
VPYERDVRAFHDRAPTYEDDWRGKMHREIATRTLDLALGANPTPRRVLDVGCGTGMFLRLLAHRLKKGGQELLGIDAASGMIDIAKARADDSRLRFSTGVAERLPCADGWFDLVISTTSFDHWVDQGAGIRECFRVLSPSGTFVLTDLFSAWLTPTLLLGRTDRARTRRRASALLREAGFHRETWHRLYGVVIATAVAKNEDDPHGFPTARPG